MPTTPNSCNYRYRLIYLFLAFSLIALCPPTLIKAAEKKQTHTLINLADQELLKMNYPKADSIYTQLLRKSPDNPELYWKLARLQISLGESIPSEKNDIRQQHYRKAEEYARTTISLDSTNGKGHTWLAASLGMMADNAGTKEKLKRAASIKRELDIALQLNPNDETALSMLGSYYREAANIGWFRRIVGNAFIGEVPKGNYELAEKAFRKAISIDPEIIRNYHELALIYIKTDKLPEAITLMKTALNQPILIASDRKRLEEMRKLLKQYSEEQ